MADGVKVPLTFKIFKGDQLVRTETLNQDIVKIGKLSSSHLRIDDEQVSRMHAVIEVTGPDEVNIIDLGSTKGTIVNGQRVNKAKLQDGDTIVLGDTKIQIAIGAAEESDEAPTMVNEGPGMPASRPAPAVASPSGSNPVFASSPRPASAQAPTMVPAPVPSAAPAPPPGFMASRPAPAPRAPAPQVSAAATFAARPAMNTEAVEDSTGSRSIEVAAMFEDQVHEVAHLTDPNAGKRSGLTIGFGVASIVAMVTTSVCFMMATGIASDDKHNHEKWADGDPDAADPALRVPQQGIYEHEEVPIGVELGFVLGLVATVAFAYQYAARSREELKPNEFRLGEAIGVEFQLGSHMLAGSNVFPLVRSTGTDWTFNFMSSWKGDVTVDGRTEPLESLISSGRATASSAAAGAYEAQIPLGARMRVDIGETTFLVNSVPPPRRHAASALANLDTRFLWYLGASTVGGIGMILLLKAIPPENANISLDQLSKPQVQAELQSKPEEAVEQPEEDTKPTADDGKEAGGTGTKTMGPEGKMGKENHKGPDGRYQIADRGPDKGLAMAQAAARGATSGLVGLLNTSGGDAFSHITGQLPFSSGFGQADIRGGLTGDHFGEASGGFGYGVSGEGWGGGGTGRGTVGLGNYGTLGWGRGTGTGFGTGSGSGSGRGHKTKRPKLNLGTAEGVGDLDREMIKREIRKNKARFEYCYEKQLLVKATLEGTVNSSFTILGNGSVRAARGSGLDPVVASCVASVLSSIQFPKPTGGGVVNVNYPFFFRQSGE